MINSVVISPNDLAQLMSGQAVTGLLNPDGSITLNSNVLSGQQIATSNGISRSTSTISMKNELPTTVSSSHVPNTITTTNNNLNPNDLYHLPSSRLSHGPAQHQQQLQDNSPPISNGIQICDSISTNTATTHQKKLTQKQKLQLQQTQQQQIVTTSSPQPQQFYHQQQQQHQSINNTQQTNVQQPQIVATIQLPDGQIGQLIAPPGGQFWSPNAINIQQQVVESNGQNVDGNDQSIVHMSNVSMPQVVGRTTVHCEQGVQQNIWSGGPISLSELSALAQQGVVQVIPMGIGCMPNNNNNQQRSVEIVTQSAINNIVSQNDSNQLDNNNGVDDITTTTVSTPHGNNNANDINVLNQSPSTPLKKLKRLACTCPNCQDNRNTGDSKKKQHICHFPDCKKVYGKTSHLRAHLRWHSGERPYECNCGKKFTRSDELQRHKRTHTGEKRFECSECFKRFMRSDHLSKHIKTHVISGSAKLT